ncbi:MAG TPA: hypothetical protein VMM55_07785 [Thermohalobaculum sp.]|nr:hypothetical protein [Thermohalobaculum sp.]
MTKETREAFDAAVRGQELPPDTERIGLTWDASKYMEFDREGNLYWAGKQLEVRKKLDLTWWQVAIAAITAFSALILAAVEVFRLFWDVGIMIQ